MIGSPIDVYRRQIERELKQADATEHTHRPALKQVAQSCFVTLRLLFRSSPFHRPESSRGQSATAADVAPGFSPAPAGLKASATKAPAGLKASTTKAAALKGGATGQYFEGVPPEVWDFHIGGYQVCEKWLKDRRGRTLSFDDLTHYQKIIAALKETLRLMAEIDAAIPKWPIE
jgi:hypothetical protein